MRSAGSDDATPNKAGDEAHDPNEDTPPTNDDGDDDDSGDDDSGDDDEGDDDDELYRERSFLSRVFNF
jgi:hypothetical protein